MKQPFIGQLFHANEESDPYCVVAIGTDKKDGLIEIRLHQFGSYLIHIRTDGRKSALCSFEHVGGDGSWCCNSSTHADVMRMCLAIIDEYFQKGETK